MAKCIGSVIFSDGQRLYLIYDKDKDIALPMLFLSAAEAGKHLENSVFDGNYVINQEDCEENDEEVNVIPDITLEKEYGNAGSFASRASRKKMRLTGARSFLEMAYANGATASRHF